MKRLLAILAWSIGVGALAQAPSAPATPAAAPPVVERGIGPFQLQTRNGELVVRLLRLEKDMLWVDQRTSSGRYIETGVPRADIVRFAVPRLPVLEAARQAATAAQAAQVEPALRRVADSLRPYRDLPGLPAHEARLLVGRVVERQDRWRDALAFYEEVAALPDAPELSSEARQRSGLCYSRLGEQAKALSALDGLAFPDDDPVLLNDLYFARAAARAAAGQHDLAVMDYLNPVVFTPHVQRAEVRALSAALPSLAALKDWTAVARTLSVLRAQYKEEPETAAAEAWAAPFAKQLEAEKDYDIPGGT